MDQDLRPAAPGAVAVAEASVPADPPIRRDLETSRPGAPHVSRIQAPYRPIIELDGGYSSLPIREGFNWSAAFAAIDEGEWYLVVFRSKHRADADDTYLTWLDERASGAASQYPGFMYYFIGTPRADGHCLSFCLWRSRPDAVAAAADPEHRAAMVNGLSFFDHYVLERYHLTKRDGALSFEPLPSSTMPPIAIAIAIATAIASAAAGALRPGDGSGVINSLVASGRKQAR